MKVKIILSLLIIAFAQISFASTQEISHQNQIQNFVNCAKGEAIHELSTLVFDLYYNKLTIPSFLEKIVEWNAKSEIDMSKCLVELKDLTKVKSGTVLSKLGLSFFIVLTAVKI